MELFSKKMMVLLMVIVMSFTLVLSGCSTTSPEPDEEVATFEADVIVIGGGASGLAAAVEAAQEGAEVILLEKMPFVGGSTLISGGLTYGAESPLQEREGVEDTVDALYDYWMEINPGAEKDLVRLVAESSGDTLAWLEEVGVNFTILDTQGVSPVRRGHWPEEMSGSGMINPLNAKAEELGVEIKLETTAKKLLTDEDGAIIGVEAVDKNGEKVHYVGKAVILATGGFDRNSELMSEYASRSADHITWVGPGNTGDGLVMAREVGAEIIAKDGVIGFRGVADDIFYFHPVGGLVFQPNIMVDPSGQRFTNEADHYAFIYNDMVDTGYDEFFLIFDNSTYAEALDQAVEMGLAFKGDTLAELAETAGIDVEQFEVTVEGYNALAVGGEDTQFGKPVDFIAPIEEPTYYALRILPLTLGSMGGPRINLDAQVINTDGEVIDGLYAAGEVANAQFYDYTYPASGTSLQFCVTMGRIAGRIAGRTAVAEVK